MTGIYLFKSNPAFASNSAGYRVASLQLNGITLIADVSCPAVNGTGTALLIGDVVLLTAGENLRVQVFQNTGGSLNLSTNRVIVKRIG